MTIEEDDGSIDEPVDMRTPARHGQMFVNFKLLIGRSGTILTGIFNSKFYLDLLIQEIGASAFEKSLDQRKSGAVAVDESILFLISDSGRGRIPGNLGYLAFVNEEGKLLHEHAVGASKRAAQWILDEGGAVVSLNVKNKVFNCLKGRENDSEYLLLNHFACGVPWSERKDLKGVVFLFTERIPCDSCEQVIYDFLEMFESVSLGVAFFHISQGLNVKVRCSTMRKKLRILSNDRRSARLMQLMLVDMTLNGKQLKKIGLRSIDNR